MSLRMLRAFKKFQEGKKLLIRLMNDLKLFRRLKNNIGVF